MGGVLGSFRLGVVVVDPELRVLAWNAAAEDLWGVRADEARGQHVLALDIGLPVAELQPLLGRQVTGTGRPHEMVEIDAIDRRGRRIRVRVTVSTFSQGEERSGAVVIMDPTDEG